MTAKKIYDYNFSREVVNDFRKAYEEAFERAKELFDLSNRSVIWLFQAEQKEWHRFRKIVKFIGENDKMLRDLYHRGPNAKYYHEGHGSYQAFLLSMIDRSYFKNDGIFGDLVLDKEMAEYYNIIGHDDKGKSPEPKQLTLFPDLLEDNHGDSVREPNRTVHFE